MNNVIKTIRIKAERTLTGPLEGEGGEVEKWYELDVEWGGLI